MAVRATFAAFRDARPLLLGLAVALLSGCADRQSPSGIADAIAGLSFVVPPTLPGGAAGPRSGAIDETKPPELPKLEAQIYHGRPQVSTALLSAGRVQGHADGVQLNFERAPIREVVKTVLGDVLGLSYVIAPEVAGEVTFSSSGPLAQADLIAILESVLRANGAAVLRTGAGSFEVVPAEAAVGQTEVLPLGGSPPRVQPGYGLTIVPLRNMAATAAAQLIQPLVATPEDIRVDPARNLLLFTGTSSERQNVVGTLADLDVDWMSGKTIGLFPLKRATPEALIAELQTLFTPTDSASPEEAPLRFVPIPRLQAVLAVSADSQQMQEIKQWIGHLDQGATIGTRTYVYFLKHAAAEDIAKSLNEAFGGARASEPTTGVGLASAVPSLSSSASSTGANEEVADSTAKPASTQPIEPSSDDPVRITAVKVSNTLLIRATPMVYADIEASLARLDTAPWQVAIEATIAEVELNDQLRYGVQFFLDTNNIKLGFSSGTDIYPSTTTPGLNFLLTPGGSNLTIDALARLTKVRVLSAPSVIVEDNSEAELTVGSEVPITTRQSTSTDTSDAPTVNSIEYRDTGVILQVRPRINFNGSVSLEVAQEVSRVSDEGDSSDTLTPTITQRKITSQVRVQSGQTVVLGGLIQTSETRNRDRVPILGELPVVGSLFGSTDNADTRTELIVFLTPRVIRNPDDAREVSEQLRVGLKSLTAPD